MDKATLLALRIPSFEAAIRKAAEPRLASRPVVVATSFKPMGRVIAPCPDARAAGVARDMPYPAAKELCPDAAFFTPDRQLAGEALRRVLRRAAAYSPRAEAAGDGCVLLDITGTERLWGDGVQVAEKARRDIARSLRLPVSAGLAARRPWSLLASRAAGEEGVLEIAPGREDDFLDSVPVAWIDGISAKTRTRLAEMNIHAAGQLRQFERGQLVLQFGRGCADILWNVVHPGEWRVGGAESDAADIADDRVTAEAFLPEASAEEETVRRAAAALAGQAAATLRGRDFGAARLRLTLLHADGVMKSACAATGGFIQDETALVETTERLLRRIFKRRVRVARLWLTAEKLAPPERQGVLFPEEPPPGRRDGPKAAALLRALDSIHARYGDDLVMPAALLPGEAGRPPKRRRVS